MNESSASTAARLLDALDRGQRLLRLTIDAPDRVPGWEVIVLTASGPAQAELYRRQAATLQEQRRLPPQAEVLVVEDPAGARIGSGGATLNVLRQLHARMGAALATRRILLIHAGGDSRRQPWASATGKILVPFPLLAHPDHPVPTLLEQVLAILAPLATQFLGGGLAVASGDVLTLCAADAIQPAANGLTLVVTPATLDVAGRHGVAVVGSDQRTVTDLLQKADAATLTAAGAVLGGGLALIDTGLVLARGAALRALIDLASAVADPVATLLAARSEISVYEEILAGCCPSRAEWLARRPLGSALATSLRGLTLTAARLDDFRFVHLGTSTDYLGHLAAGWQGGMTRRILAEHGALAASGSTLLHSRVAAGVRVGHGSLVAFSCLGQQVAVGNRSVVVNVVADEQPLVLPDHACLWQVPMVASADRKAGWATLCCGVDDNPKDAWPDATFLGQRIGDWAATRGLTADALWPAGTARLLWTARLFPVQPDRRAAAGIAWLLDGDGAAAAEIWRTAPRVSMADAAAGFDAPELSAALSCLDDRLALAHLARATATLADVAVPPFARACTVAARTGLAALADHVPVGTAGPIPRSRRLRLRADLLAAAGCPVLAEQAGELAWNAVGDEVAAAIEHSLDEPVHGCAAGSTAMVELPARLDLAGGWSDTPPYCLEHPASVLNLALSLDGSLPIGARATALAQPRWELVLGQGDGSPGQVVVLAEGEVLTPIGGVADPHALLKLACLVAGFGSGTRIHQGVRLESWSAVPKGSGLGTSSILAAALVQALARLAGRADDAATIMRRVLTVEQMLGTRGGWQDQLGGLIPGIKLLRSLPLRPLRVSVQAVRPAPAVIAELEDRLVIAYTGINRLARDVLQRVVAGYLARDARVVHGIARLAELAEEGAVHLARGDLDALGDCMHEVWHRHQQLDPHCSNPAVDALLAPIAPHACGWKLAGAGGGGFVAILAQPGKAGTIRQMLGRTPGVRVEKTAIWHG